MHLARAPTRCPKWLSFGCPIKHLQQSAGCLVKKTARVLSPRKFYFRCRLVPFGAVLWLQPCLRCGAKRESLRWTGGLWQFLQHRDRARYSLREPLQQSERRAPSRLELIVYQSAETALGAPWGWKTDFAEVSLRVLSRRAKTRRQQPPKCAKYRHVNG